MARRANGFLLPKMVNERGLLTFLAVLALSGGLMVWCVSRFSEPFGVSLPSADPSPLSPGTALQAGNAHQLSRILAADQLKGPIELAPGAAPFADVALAATERPLVGAPNQGQPHQSQESQELTSRNDREGARVAEAVGESRQQNTSFRYSTPALDPADEHRCLDTEGSNRPMSTPPPIPQLGGPPEMEWFGLKLRQVNPWLPGINQPLERIPRSASQSLSTNPSRAVGTRAGSAGLPPTGTESTHPLATGNHRPDEESAAFSGTSASGVAGTGPDELTDASSQTPSSGRGARLRFPHRQQRN